MADVYSGPFPELRLIKSNAQVKADAVTWGKKIAKNKSFHYGKGKHSHHNGCYYCETQPASKKKAGIKMWETTYCCNPFVGACWAHGGCVPEAIELCRKGKSWSFGKNDSVGYEKSKLFEKLGHPAKSKLKKGDVLCSSTHVALYVGDGKVVEAGAEDDNKKHSAKWNASIRVKKLSDSYYKSFTRVYRYKSFVNKNVTIYPGEYSERVRHMQAFFNWYYNCGLKITGFYNDKTRKVVKRFQKEVGLNPTGKVGKKTIAAMKAAKKSDPVIPVTPAPAAPKPVQSSLADKIISTCKVQAEWMKNYTYNWAKWKPKNVEKSKKYGTCVTFVACVLQRMGYLKSGQYIWHNGKGYGTGKVYGTNSKMTVTYMKNKTFTACKSKLKKGDIILVDDNKSGKEGSGGHIMIFTGKWNSKGNPVIWDNHSAERIKKGKGGSYGYGKNRKILAIVRLKEK